MSRKASFKRVVLKISGEAFVGEHGAAIDPKASAQIARAIKEVSDLGVQVSVVIGGGNIFRGSQADALGFERTPADQIGMMATVINGLVLQQSLSKIGSKSHVMSAISCDAIVEPFSWPCALSHLENKQIVIFVGGTGNPYFTTDTAAALRACEMNAEVVLKGTKVDGIYDKDPRKFPNATKYPKLTYGEVLTKKLDVMDATAIALCREHNILIYVFNLFEKDALLKAICQREGGSLVMGE
jgi:uridylate kinase